MTRFRFLPLALLALLWLASCDKEKRCYVPIGDATCQLDPNSPLYAGLNSCDGYEYLVGGYNGIVVIRTGWNDFVAYERSCPVDTGRLEISPDNGNLILQCPKCGSRFSTFAGGAPVTGNTSPCYLYQYGTYYDGRILYISNY